MATPTPSRPSRAVIVAFGPPGLTRDARQRAQRLVASDGDVIVVAAYRGATEDDVTQVGTDGLRAVLEATATPTLLLHDDVRIGRDGVAAMMRAWQATNRPAAPWTNASGTDHHVPGPIPVDDDARARLARRLPLRGGPAAVVRPICLLAGSGQLRELAERFLTVADTLWNDPTVQVVTAGKALAHHSGECAAAEPATTGDEPLLVASMIVRNEAASLPDCLASLDGLVDRIEICDTGSTDDTMAIAESFGANVIQRAWHDDFAWARNEVLERCRDATYILQIDADERVRCDDPDVVRRRLALLRDNVRVFSVPIYNIDDAGNVSSTHDGPRVVRTDDVTYRGALHERPWAIDGVPLVSQDLKLLRLEHLGYRQRTVTERSKSERNITISERAYRDTPDWETAFQYARSLSVGGQDDRSQIADLLHETLSAGDEVPITWRAWALGKLGRDALAADDAEAALDLAQQALSLVPADPVAGATLTEAAKQLGRTDLIIEQRTTRRSTVSPRPFSRLADATARVAGAEIAALLEFGATNEAFSEAAAALAADPAHFTGWPALVGSVAGAHDEDAVDDLLLAAALNDKTGGCITAIARTLAPSRASGLCARYLRGGGTDTQAVRNGIATTLVAGDAALVDHFLPDAHRLEPAILERLADVAAQRGLELQSNDIRTLAALPRRNFIVCGAGRSGTGYMSKALTALGHPCGHETVFGPLASAAEFGALQGDSSWLALPYLDDLPSNAVIFHQVRDPLEVVRSLVGIRMLTAPSPYLDFIAEHAPEVVDQPDEISRCMAYWVVWNRRIARHADGTRPYVGYRLEDLEPAVFSQFAGLLGSVQPPEVVERRLEAVPNNYNARRRDESVTMATLPDGELKDELVDLAEEVGYELAPVVRGA